MANRMHDDGGRTGREIPGEAARQGRIVLNTPARRAIFIAGLVGLAVLAAFGWALA